MVTMTKKILLVVIIAVLAAGNVFLGWKALVYRGELKTERGAAKAEGINKQVAEFNQLFVEKVLKAQGEIDFDTRLQLENSARAIGDKEILAQWQKFTDSKDQLEAQVEVKNLLSLLAKKTVNE
jgi:hypothetical protein